jgi:hypothetical protein
MKSIKKQKDEKRSESSAKPSRLYLYHNQMCILKKIIDSTTTQESAEDGPIEQNKGSNQTDEREKTFLMNHQLTNHVFLVYKKSASQIGRVNWMQKC